jgi:hypothetical protein
MDANVFDDFATVADLHRIQAYQNLQGPSVQ